MSPAITPSSALPANATANATSPATSTRVTMVRVRREVTTQFLAPRGWR